MLTIYQIFKKKETFTKANYSSEKRKEFFHWPDEMQTSTGYVKEGILFLPETAEKGLSLGLIKGIILQDTLGVSEDASKIQVARLNKLAQFPDWYVHQNQNKNPELFALNKQAKKSSFEVFHLHETTDGVQELHLNYAENRLLIGRPERENHKLCNLSSGSMIHIQLNGKNDFSLTSRRERTYTERAYIVHSLGEVSKVEFVKMNQISQLKKIPAEFDKVIDLRKMLY